MLFLIFFFIALLIENPDDGIGEIVFLSTTVLIALVGCVISWWREQLAGVLLVLTFVGLVIAAIIMYGLTECMEWARAGLPFLISGFLFFVSWWISKELSLSPCNSDIKD